LPVAPFLPLLTRRDTASLFGAAPLLPQPAYTYAFPSTSTSAQSGATSILLIYTPRPFLALLNDQSVNCQYSTSLDLV
jgi:hypothetical protein